MTTFPGKVFLGSQHPVFTAAIEIALQSLVPRSRQPKHIWVRGTLDVPIVTHINTYTISITKRSSALSLFYAYGNRASYAAPATATTTSHFQLLISNESISKATLSPIISILCSPLARYKARMRT